MDGLEPSTRDGEAAGARPQQLPAARRPESRRLAAFLFADIRGFTAFTDRAGPDAAAALASSLVEAARTVTREHGGRLAGTWGDEVLLEFDSPRDAIRAAVDLQATCVAATLDADGTPLLVGMGLDLGEAASANNGPTAAGGVNTAARLCALAGPGEILTTADLAHTAGALDGVAFVDLGSRRLRGVAEPRFVMLVRDNAVDPRRMRRFEEIVRATRERRRTRRLRVVALVVVVAAVITGIGSWGIGRLTQSTPVIVPPGGIAVVDQASGHLVDAFAPTRPAGALAAAGGDAWVAETGTGGVLRYDTDGYRLLEQADLAPAPVSIAVTKSDLWAVNGLDRDLHRVNKTTGQQTAHFPVGNQPEAVVAGFGSVWVANAADNTVSQVDPRTDHVLREIPVGRGPDGLAVGAGAVWVANGKDDTVQRIDARTASAGAPITVGAGPRGIAVSAGSVWVANSLDLTVSRIDSRQADHAVSVSVGDTPTAVAATRSSAWVAVSAAGDLVRVDASGATLTTRATRLGASPLGVAIVGDKVWVSTQPFTSPQHIGGTLRVAAAMVTKVAGQDLDLDPARAFDSNLAQMTLPVYDGLLTLRKADGAGGFDLVPDLADSIPRPSDGGLTYTFTVRRGVRYSDGRLVRPADFRRGLTREFTATHVKGHPVAGASSYFSNIVGAAQCMADPRRCDLGAGVTTDPRTVTFHLTRPDPDFPFHLSLLLAAPAPPGSPRGPATLDHPLPGTGPYRIASAAPGKGVVLTRNPHFRVWSTAAQPPGYPDRIVFLPYADAKGAPAVLRGEVDVAGVHGPARDLLADLRLNHAEQLHVDPWAQTNMLELNTHRRPFSNVLARRALAFALDRRRMAGQTDVPACQLLPASFPGYQPRCRYTRRAGPHGTWHGPDLRRARHLAARSGTRDDPVVILPLPGEPLGKYVAGVLRRLGYRHVHLRHVRPGGFFALASGDHDVTFWGWIADFPTAWAFYHPLLACDPARANNILNFCDRALDRQAATATALEVTDPGGANQLWTRIFAEADDKAPIIPFAHATQTYLLSPRAGNYQVSPQLGPLFDQIWVK